MTGGAQHLNCFSSPGVCGYPQPGYAWPTSTNAWAEGGGGVGPTNGAGTSVACSSLAQHAGYPSTTPNQVIANQRIIGGITITSSGVTLNNDCIIAPGAGAPAGERLTIISDGASGGNLTITNSEIAFENNTTSSGQDAVYNGSGVPVTLKHDYIHSCGECIHNGPFVVQDSYVIADGEQLDTNCPTCEHFEVWYGFGDTITATHDTLLNPQGQTAVIFGDTAGGRCGNNVTVTNSLLAGGGWEIQTCSKATSGGSAVMRITNNNFARCTTAPITDNNCQGASGYSIGDGADSRGYWPRGGYFGVATATFCTGTNKTWSGNAWDDVSPAVQADRVKGIVVTC